MRRSDLALALLAVAIAVGLLLVVRGEKRVTATYTVAVRSVLPADLRPEGPLPSEATIAVSGPWSRLRTLDPAALGALRLDLSRATPGVATWYVKPEALHLPRGVRVDAVHPAQGSVELRRP
jgi:hypothetical protein